MPSVTIPAETLERLAKRAATLNVTIEQLIAPLLELASKGDTNGDPARVPPVSSFEEWGKKFDS